MKYVVATSRLEACTIILFVVLINKMLIFKRSKYVKHYRRYTVGFTGYLKVILDSFFENCQTLNFEQMIHRVS